MSSFTEPLCVEITQKEVSKRGLAVLVQPFDYLVGDFNNPSDIIHIPVGFKTDFMSIPMGFRNFVSVFDRCAKAAVVHDYMLVSGYDITYTNKVFREAMLVLGASKLKATIIYWAVQIYTHIRVGLGGTFKPFP